MMAIETIDIAGIVANDCQWILLCQEGEEIVVIQSSNWTDSCPYLGTYDSPISTLRSLQVPRIPSM